MKKVKKYGNDAIKTAQLRSGIYGFLAIIYLKELSAESIKSFKKPEVLNNLKGMGFNPDKKFLNTGENVLSGQLAAEYNRLFIIPPVHISMYASVWLDKDKILWGETTSGIKKIIESVGLSYKDNWDGLPDHIGVLFEFMKKLVEKETSALATGDNKTASSCAEYEKRFLNEYMFNWVRKFCETVKKETKSPFYREMAGLTERFIEFEEKEVE